MRRRAAVCGAVLVLLVALGSGCYRRPWNYEESARIDAVMGRGYEPLRASEAYGLPMPRDESVLALAPVRTERAQRTQRSTREAAKAKAKAAPRRQAPPAQASKGSAKKQARTDFRFSGF